MRFGVRAGKAEGAASVHDASAREEAAAVLIGNHFKLLQDVCNPSKFLNINGVPLTQIELSRVPAPLAPLVDEGLRAVSAPAASLPPPPAAQRRHFHHHYNRHYHRPPPSSTAAQRRPTPPNAAPPPQHCTPSIPSRASTLPPTRQCETRLPLGRRLAKPRRRHRHAALIGARRGVAGRSSPAGLRGGRGLRSERHCRGAESSRADRAVP